MTSLAPNPILPSGTYTWDLPSGGSAGFLTMHATVRGGELTEWYSVSGDGARTIRADAATLSRWGHNYLHALRAEIDHRLRLAPLGLSLPPVEFVAAPVLTLRDGLGGVHGVGYSVRGERL